MKTRKKVQKKNNKKRQANPLTLFLSYGGRGRICTLEPERDLIYSQTRLLLRYTPRKPGFHPAFNPSKAKARYLLFDDSISKT